MHAWVDVGVRVSVHAYVSAFVLGGCTVLLLLLLRHHFNSAREETVDPLLESIPSRSSSPFPHTLSPWILRLNMRRSVWPGWVFNKT